MQQRRIAELLRPLLEWWLNVCRKTVAFVGADQFIYWRQHNPRVAVSPDVYVIPGVPPDADPKAWLLWQHDVMPSIAIEVVSDDWEKDYREMPEKYGDLGIPELVIFDPKHDAHPEGVRWQVYRRVGKRGLVRVEVTNRDRVKSRTLRCWLRAVGSGQQLCLRIAEGATGDLLVPTAEERAATERSAKEAERTAKEAERAAKEAERAAKEAERAAKEAERAAKEEALARIAVLEAELQRLKSGAAGRRSGGHRAPRRKT